MTDPLRDLSADEIAAVRAVVVGAGLVADTTRFVYVGLDEPGHAELAAPEAPERRARVYLHDVTSPAARDVTVSLASRAVLRIRELDATVDGQLPVLDEEFALVERLLATDPDWLAALEARKLDVAEVRVAPLSAGVYDDCPGEEGRRILRGLAFHQPHPRDQRRRSPARRGRYGPTRPVAADPPVR